MTRTVNNVREAPRATSVRQHWDLLTRNERQSREKGARANAVIVAFLLLFCVFLLLLSCVRHGKMPGSRKADNKRLSSLSIAMPAFNEEANIAATVLDAASAAKKVADEYEIVVVDDASSDGTAETVAELAARDRSIRLIGHRVNKGYGAAVRTGLNACRLDWIFITDSDGQFHYDELSAFAEETDGADLVIGYRKKRMDPFHRVFVAQVLLRVWNLCLFGLAVRDVDCAYKLLARRVRDEIELTTASAITVTELIVKALRRGYKIKQLPVTHYPRKFGRQTGGDWRVIMRAARQSFRLRRELSSVRADGAISHSKSLAASTSSLTTACATRELSAVYEFHRFLRRVAHADDN